MKRSMVNRAFHWLCLLLIAGLPGCQHRADTRIPPANVGQPSAADSFLGAKAGEEREVGGVKLCWCPPGRFRMGSPPDEPERRPGETQVLATLSMNHANARGR